MQTNLTDEGYVMFRGVVPLDRIRALYETTVYLLGKYDLTLTKSDLQMILDETPFSGERFNSALIELRKSQPKLFGILYDTVQLSGAIQQVCDAPGLLEAVSQAWNVPIGGMAVTGHMLRMDAPQDTRNVLDWHQDCSYYTQNLEGRNGLVVWIPMHHVDASNGAVIVCPYSHREGKIEVSMTGKENEVASEQYKIPQEALDRYEQLQVSGNAGDALIFNMDLFHRSGRNTSSRIRFVAGVRIHNMLADDFLPGKLFYEPNKSIGRFGEYKKANGLTFTQ